MYIYSLLASSVARIKFALFRELLNIQILLTFVYLSTYCAWAVFLFHQLVLFQKSNPNQLVVAVSTAISISSAVS